MPLAKNNKVFRLFPAPPSMQKRSVPDPDMDEFNDHLWKMPGGPKRRKTEQKQLKSRHIKEHFPSDEEHEVERLVTAKLCLEQE